MRILKKIDRMKKYWIIIKNTWDEYATYRLNFVLWRVRMVIRFFITYFLWVSIFSIDQNLFGYSREQMLTYVLSVYVVSNFVFATRTQEVGAEINEGKLTNYLLQPFGYFSWLWTRDVSDKLINFIFTIFETALLLFFLKPPLFIQTNIFLLLVAIVAVLGSIVVYFCISLLLSFIGFWTSEIWATRFIFLILLDFLAGNFFPIDILPPVVAKILLLTPFPYLFYFPIKLYLGQLSMIEISTGFGVLSFWTIILIQGVVYMWKKGLKMYSAEGR